MSKVSVDWDAMCTVFLENRDQFRLNVNPKDDELSNIGKVYENGFVQKLVSDWLSKLHVTRVSSDKGPDESKLETIVQNSKCEEANLCVTEERISESKGRFVVATNDLPESAPIIHERAFVLVPVYADGYVPGKSRPFCSHCMSALTRNSLKCSACKRISYCSDACVAAASTSDIHQFQCKGYRMGLFHDLGVSHLAVNAVLTGIDSLCQWIGNGDEDQQRWCEMLDKMNEMAQQDGSNYANVLRLNTNYGHSSADDYMRFALTATMFTFYLRDHTDFKFKLSEHVVAALILRHMGQIVNNAHTMYGMVLKDTLSEVHGSDVQLGQLHERLQVDVIATGLFPRIAILNHSCDPNIRNHFSRDRLTILATRAIATGEEVFNGYCPSYKLLDGPKRRQLLKEQYGFDCDCARCVPGCEDDLLTQFQTYICQTADCNQPIVPDGKQSKWWRDGDQPERPLCCSQCTMVLDLGWSDQFMSLFERDVESVQQLKWLTQDTCDAYAEACRRMAVHHLQKWDMASMVLKLLPIAQVEFTGNDGALLGALVQVAADYANGVGQQFGGRSLEYIEASAFWLDMLSRQKAATGDITSSRNELARLRAIIEEEVSVVVWPIYEKYFSDFL